MGQNINSDFYLDLSFLLVVSNNIDYETKYESKEDNPEMFCISQYQVKKLIGSEGL